jgi:hypothetical protein
MSVREARTRWLVLLAAVALAGWMTTIVAWRERPSSRRPSGSAIQYEITYEANRRREVTATTRTVLLHQRSFVSAGQPVLIRWYDSDVELLAVGEIARVVIAIDGTPVTSMVKTSLNGTYEDGQGDLMWTGTVPRGHHTIAVQVHSTGGLGMPYTYRGQLGTDELVIQNVSVHAA